jgi:hypothetical protein
METVMKCLGTLSIIRLIPAATICVVMASPSLADDAADKAAIQQVMRGTWEKPDSPLRVEPIVVASDYAIADWTQGDMGGRALLRQTSGRWSIVLCSGDALKSADALIKAAIPRATADELEKALAKAEASLDPKIVAQFSRFEGLVMMDQADHHPPHHK